MSTFKVQPKDPNDASNSWMAQIYFQEFKNHQDLPSSNLPFFQFLEGVQPERSWNLTLEVQVDYFSNGFSINTIVLLRVYNQQFQRNILWIVLASYAKASKNAEENWLGDSWDLFAVICVFFVSFFDIFPSSATSFNLTELSTRALREVQHHDIPLAMWASKICREMVRLLVYEWRQVDLQMIQGMWPTHWTGTKSAWLEELPNTIHVGTSIIPEVKPHSVKMWHPF